MDDARNDVLLIIDMQHPFVKDDDERVARVALLARQARERGNHICVIQDTHGRPLFSLIKAELDGYANQSEGWKSQWDGSLQVQIALGDKLIVPTSFMLCGAFAEECVFDTLIGVRDRYPGIPLSVVRDACCPAPIRQFDDDAWKKRSKKYDFAVV